MVNSLLLLTLATSACVSAVAVPSRQASISKEELLKRQEAPPWVGPGGKVPDPAGAAPRRVVLKSDMKVPGVQRVKIR